LCRRSISLREIDTRVSGFIKLYKYL
jgi:hypothetical protein